MSAVRLPLHLLSAAVLLGFAAVSTAAPLSPADFDSAALGARLDRLRPALEAALAEPFDDPIAIGVADEAAMARILRAEACAHGPGGAAPGISAFRGAARITAGKLELATGRLWVQPEAFHRLAAAGPEFAGVAACGFLDVILLHEAVHAWQHRTFSLDRFFGRPATAEEAHCRASVLEGHAQHVARKAAESLGLVESLELLRRLNLPRPAGEGSRAADFAAGHRVALAGLPYVEGEAFFADVAKRLGYEAAVERVFTDPPVVLRHVVNPGEYLAPRAPALTQEIRAAVADLLRPRGGTVRASPFPAPALRAALPALPPEVVARGLGGYREGVLFVSAHADGGAGRSAALYEFASPADAAEFVRFQRTVAREKDRLCAEGPIRIRDARYASLAEEGLDGFIMTKVVEAPRESGTTVTRVFRVGRLVVELSAGAGDPDGELAVARRIAERLAPPAGA